MPTRPTPSVRLAAAAAVLVMTSAHAAPAREQAAPAVACTERPAFRELAFWLGDWDVSERGSRIGESRVEILDGACAILETFTQPDGFSGRSLNFVDPVLGRWRQSWVDRFGNVSEFRGRADAGGLLLEGESHRLDGAVVGRTMRLSPTPDGHVRQYSERSTDGGRTWTVAYDYLYTRRSPGRAR